MVWFQLSSPIVLRKERLLYHSPLPLKILCGFGVFHLLVLNSDCSPEVVQWIQYNISFSSLFKYLPTKWLMINSFEEKQADLVSHSVFSTLILTLLIYPDFLISFCFSCGIYCITETEEILSHLNITLVGLLVISVFLCEC